MAHTAVLLEDYRWLTQCCGLDFIGGPSTLIFIVDSLLVLSACLTACGVVFELDDGYYDWGEVKSQWFSICFSPMGKDVEAPPPPKLLSTHNSSFENHAVVLDTQIDSRSSES